MRMRANTRELRAHSSTAAAWQSAHVDYWMRKPDRWSGRGDGTPKKVLISLTNTRTIKASPDFVWEAFMVLVLIGRGEKIRTSDPHNPIVVRYQAALRPDRVLVNTRWRQ